MSFYSAELLIGSYSIAECKELVSRKSLNTEALTSPFDSGL